MLEVDMRKSYFSTDTAHQRYTVSESKGADTMTDKDVATKEEVKFSEQNMDGKLALINQKLDTTTASLNRIIDKLDRNEQTVNSINTDVKVLSEKESTTRALAWAIIVAVLGGLIKIFFF